MDIPRKRIPLFYAALALTLLHPQFFEPGALTIPLLLEKIPTLLDALNWLPAFLGMAVLAACVSWDTHGHGRLFRRFLLAGAIFHLIGYAVFAARGVSVLPWRIALNLCCMIGPAAALLALRDWLKSRPEATDNAIAGVDALLAFTVPAVLCDVSLLLTRVFSPIDPMTYQSTPWAIVLRVGCFLGGLVYWLRPVAAVILLYHLFRPIRNAMKREG